jgi:hypothetical protein
MDVVYQLRQLGIRTRGLPRNKANKEAVVLINRISHTANQSTGTQAHHYRRRMKVLLFNSFVRGRLGLPIDAYLTREQGGLSVWEK